MGIIGGTVTHPAPLTELSSSQSSYITFKAVSCPFEKHVRAFSPFIVLDYFFDLIDYSGKLGDTVTESLLIIKGPSAQTPFLSNLF